ncbi:MAG: response regulator transcription factor [Elusimicrobiota bacterium]
MSAKILVVDDEKNILSMLKIIFETEDFDVLTSENGKEALEIVEKEGPELVLLDLMMPVMDGFEVLTEMKNNQLINKIPVIIFSALKQDDIVEKALEMGADDYVAKDSGPQVLIEKVKETLNKKE